VNIDEADGEQGILLENKTCSKQCCSSIYLSFYLYFASFLYVEYVSSSLLPSYPKKEKIPATCRTFICVHAISINCAKDRSECYMLHKDKASTTPPATLTRPWVPNQFSQTNDVILIDMKMWSNECVWNLVTPSPFHEYLCYSGSSNALGSSTSPEQICGPFTLPFST